MRKGWFSNTSFTIGLKTLPTFRPDPVVKLVLENQPFLMPEPAEKPSLQTSNGFSDVHTYVCNVRDVPV